MKQIRSRFIAVSHYLSGVTFGVPLGANMPWHVLVAATHPRTLYSLGWCFSYVLVVSSASFFAFGKLDIAFALKYLIVVISAFLPFWYPMSVIREMPAISRIIFWFLIFFGLLQTFGLPSHISSFIELLIPKFRGQPWGEGTNYRGVSLLWSEPAQASFYLLMAFVLGFWNFKEKSFALLALMLAQLFLVKSVTGIFLVFFLVLLIYPLNIRRYIGVLFLVSGVFWASILTNPKLSGAYNAFLSAGAQNAFNFLAERSGGRVSTPFYSAHRFYENYGMPLLDESTLEPNLFVHPFFGLVNNVGYFSSNHSLVGGWVFFFFLGILLLKFRFQIQRRILVLITVLSFAYSPAWTPFLVLAARVNFDKKE